ncbi:PmbA/TldA family metallopeptidase [Pyrobaculum neutrophilum]|uniref:PmbA/TldA family metallopeptidase n=1 Tax=Pyrobaculum neutrophilum TaxID=70771 RepID=UPI0001617019
MEDLLRRAVDYGLSLGASYVEVRWQRDGGVAAAVRNGQYELSASFSSEGVAVRAVAGGGMGFAAVPKAELEEVLAAVERAVKLAKAAARARKGPVALSEEKLAKVSYSLPAVELDPLELVKTLDGYAAGGLAVRRLYASVWTTEKRILTSDGADVYSRVPRAYLFGMFIAHEPSLGSLQRDIFLGGTTPRLRERRREGRGGGV